MCQQWKKSVLHTMLEHRHVQTIGLGSSLQGGAEAVRGLPRCPACPASGARSTTYARPPMPGASKTVEYVGKGGDMVHTSSNALSHTDFGDLVLQVLDDYGSAVYTDSSSDRRNYAVRLRSPVGELQSHMRFPFDALELETRLLKIERAILSSGRTPRAVPAEWNREVQGYGQALFEAVMDEEGREFYYQTRDEAEHDGKGLRLMLRLEPPELRALPWEILFDARHAEFVGLGPGTTIVRELESPRRAKPLPIEPPLRILGAVASPGRPDTQVVENERAQIENALATLVTDGLVELRWLQVQTLRDLQREIRRETFHVFHLVGQDQFGLEADERLITLADQPGVPHLLPPTELGELLADEEGLRLVVLNSCGGAPRAHLSFAASLAAPAVLAMQCEVTDQAVIEFWRTIYEAIVTGVAVDVAVYQGRQAVLRARPGSLEWAVPVLYQQAPNHFLFSRRQSAEEMARNQDARSAVTPPALLETVESESSPGPGVPYGDRIVGSMKSMFAALQQYDAGTEPDGEASNDPQESPNSQTAGGEAGIVRSRRFAQRFLGMPAGTPGTSPANITPTAKGTWESLGSLLNKRSTDLSISAARKWIEDTKGGLRLASRNVRGSGSVDLTWADMLYSRLGRVNVYVLYFASRFDQALDSTATAALWAFGENTPPTTSVSCWDPRDPEFSRALGLFGLKAPPALIFVSGLQLEGMVSTSPERAPLYSVAITDEDILGDKTRLASSANTIHEVIMRGDPKEMESYLLQRRLDALVDATGNVGEQLRDQFLALKPKIGLPGGISIQLG